MLYACTHTQTTTTINTEREFFFSRVVFGHTNLWLTSHVNILSHSRLTLLDLATTFDLSSQTQELLDSVPSTIEH